MKRERPNCHRQSGRSISTKIYAERHRARAATIALYSLLLTLYYLSSSSLYYLAALDAARANLHALGSTARRSSGLHRLKVRVPATTSHIVGVRNIVTELRSLTAKLTYICHNALQNYESLSQRRSWCRNSPEELSREQAPVQFLRLLFPASAGESGRHERIRTADLYRVKVAL